jgi:hypothetical protein
VNEPLDRAIDTALRGDKRPLYDLLTRGSGLPGPRHNRGLVDAFVAACKPKKTDALAVEMATLHPDNAPGNTALEFLPVCGVMAVASRAAEGEKARKKLLPVLHEAAEDLRFRVRDAVVQGLVIIGEKTPDALLGEVASWMDGYFHAAAVLAAVTGTAWLAAIKEPNALLARLDEAFILARDAPRAAWRYPGHKQLIEQLEKAPSAIAARFGVPLFDLLVSWSVVKEPALRELIVRSISKLAGRYNAEVARVKKTLEETEPAPRNPDHYVGPTRGRGRKR